MNELLIVFVQLFFPLVGALVAVEFLIRVAD